MKDIQMEAEDVSLFPDEGKPLPTYETNNIEISSKESDAAVFPQPPNNTTDRDETLSDKDVYNDKTTEDTANDNPLLPGGESQPEGLINENGEINWNCPCLQGMGDGPCGEQFKEAFSCFHYSEEELKGVDCIEQFRAMQACFVQFPEIYGSFDEDLEDENFEETSSKENENENVDIEKDTKSPLKESVNKLDDNTKLENMIETIENDSSLYNS